MGNNETHEYGRIKFLVIMGTVVLFFASGL